MSSLLDTSPVLPGILVLLQNSGSAGKSLKLAEFLVHVYFQAPKLWKISRLCMIKEFPDYAVTLCNCVVNVLYLTMGIFTSAWSCYYSFHRGGRKYLDHKPILYSYNCLYAVVKLQHFKGVLFFGTGQYLKIVAIFCLDFVFVNGIPSFNVYF